MPDRHSHVPGSAPEPEEEQHPAGRRRFLAGALAAGAASLANDWLGLGDAAAQIRPTRPEPRPDGPKVGQVLPPNRVKVKEFTFTPEAPRVGDTVTFTLTIEATGVGTLQVPWILRRGTARLDAGTQAVRAGATAAVRATWTAVAGNHMFWAFADPDNTLAEPQAELPDNVARPLAVNVVAAARATVRWDTGIRPERPRPGEQVTISFHIDTTGAGPGVLPWVVYRNDDVLARGAERNLVAAISRDLTANWTATGGEHRFHVEVDPENTWNVPAALRTNTKTVVIPVAVVDWARIGARAKDAARDGIRAWVSQAEIVSGNVEGPAAFITKASLRSTRDFSAAFGTALIEAGAPGAAAKNFAAALWGAWRTWATGYEAVIPAAFPAFAAWPGPKAPPTPAATPHPLRAGRSDGANDLRAADLAASIKARLGADADAPGADAAITDFAAWFAGRFNAWSLTAVFDNTKLLGSGPVPSFAPPYVPVGSVVGGKLNGKNVLIGPEF